jgi:hypothetical protein
MNEPIPISKSEDLITTDEIIELDRARHQRNIQWVFLGLIAFVVVGFLTPLFVWLTRLALGG